MRVVESILPTYLNSTDTTLSPNGFKMLIESLKD